MDEAPLTVLRFATGRIGCLLPVLAPTTLLLAWWAIRPDTMPGGGRRGWLVELVKPMTAGGINLPVLLLALYLLWETYRFGMRWADRIAVTADAEGLVFHWSLLRRRRVAWSEIRDARFRVSTRHWARVPEIEFVLDGARVTVRGFDDEDGAGERFAAAVRERARPG